MPAAECRAPRHQGAGRQAARQVVGRGTSHMARPTCDPVPGRSTVRASGVHARRGDATRRERGQTEVQVASGECKAQAKRRQNGSPAGSSLLVQWKRADWFHGYGCVRLRVTATHCLAGSQSSQHSSSTLNLIAKVCVLPQAACRRRLNASRT
jgi:hypothetical protein